MRAQSEIETRILRMIEPTAAGLGLDVVRIRIMGSRTPILQIMAERPDGTVSVEDCAKLSRRLSPLLEEHDPIDGEYTLEVSSPGIDRPLTRPGDFARWPGHEIRIEVGAPIDGRRRFHGHIAGEADGVVTLNLKDGGTASIAFRDMVKAQLALTDALIDAVKAQGLDAGEIDEDFEAGFDEVEVDDDSDDERGIGDGASIDPEDDPISKVRE
ncbi:MAG: ribosome maturation factor RimP [Alphaproteobacteria bacterium]|nr:ribosome maturation factor RimP [Alphaproteobacteria bacterium]